MINSLSLPGYQLVDSDEQNEDIHFRLEAPTPVACEGCGVQGEFVFPIVICPSTASGSLSGWSAADTPAGPARQHSGPSYRRWWTDSV